MFARILAVLIAAITTVTGGVWGAYRSLHASAISLVLWAFGLSLIALPLNCFDATRWLNGVIGIFAVIAVVAIATSPRLALLLLGSGVIASPSTPRAGIATVAEVWARFVGTVVLYLSVFFLVASTIELSRNWAVLPALYLALAIIFLAGPLWGWQTRWAKPLVYGYALVVLIVGFGAMIPGATYVQWLGLDPYAYLGTSPVSEKLYEVQRLQDEKERMDSLKRLGDIHRKIEGGTELNSEEQKFLRSLSVGGSVAQKTTEVVASATATVGEWWATDRRSTPDKPVAAQEVTVNFPATGSAIVDLPLEPGDRLEYFEMTTPFRLAGSAGLYTVSDPVIIRIGAVCGPMNVHGAGTAGTVKVRKL